MRYTCLLQILEICNGGPRSVHTAAPNGKCQPTSTPHEAPGFRNMVLMLVRVGCFDKEIIKKVGDTVGFTGTQKNSKHVG